jgi:Zn-dependent M28 family amino/carboxypeptidase
MKYRTFAGKHCFFLLLKRKIILMKLKILTIGLIAVLASTISCEQGSGSSKSKTKKVEKKPVVVPRFNGDSAYNYVEKQVSFGPRVPGSKAHQECASWLIDKFSRYSDTVILQKFMARTYDQVTRNGVNIIASFSPEKKNRILLMSHWDSRPFADHDPNPENHNKPIDGANDGASGVGVLLELARQFSLQRPEDGIDIVLFDLEDWGPPTQMNIYQDELWGLGSQYWSKNPHVLGYEASFGILLDMVGVPDPTFRKEYFSKEYARYFLDLVWATAMDIGYGDYFLDEDGGAVNDDHVFVNRIAKIPAIDIIYLDPKNAEHTFFKQWHTVDDNMNYVSKESLKMVGQVVLTVVYNY